MKIAIITLNNPFEKIAGGIDSVVYNLSKALIGLGHEVWIVCLGNVKNEIVTKREGVNLWILPDNGKGLFTRSLIFAICGRRAIRELERRGIKVFNGQGGLSSPLAFFKPKNAKVFLTVHTLDGEEIANIKDCVRIRKFKEALVEAAKYPLLKIWRIFYLSRADYWIFVSKVAQKELKKHYWFLRKRCFLIPNGFHSTEINSKMIGKEYDFIYVGRIDKRKCVDLIIKASKILVNKNYDFSLAIVGRGPWKSDIEKLIYKYNLSKYIHLIGFLNQYEDVLMQILKSKFLILPSLYESDPLVIKEALSLSVPCIVSDIPALTAKIKKGYNGFLFKNLNYKHLADVMEKALFLDSKEYSKMSNNSKKSIENRNWIKVAKEYIKIFKGCVKK